MCQLKPENIYFLGQCILVNWYISRCFISSKQRPSMLVIPIQINRSIIWPHFNWCGSRIGKQQGKCYIAAFTWIYGFMAHNLLSKTKVKYCIFCLYPFSSLRVSRVGRLMPFLTPDCYDEWWHSNEKLVVFLWHLYRKLKNDGYFSGRTFLALINKSNLLCNFFFVSCWPFRTWLICTLKKQKRPTWKVWRDSREGTRKNGRRQTC